jgi:hypothetical protein
VLNKVDLRNSKKKKALRNLTNLDAIIGNKMQSEFIFKTYVPLRKWLYGKNSIDLELTPIYKLLLQEVKEAEFQNKN